MRKHLAAVGLFSALAITGVMTLTLNKNDTIPVRGKGLQLSCLISGDFTADTISWFSPRLPNTPLSFCTLDGPNFYVCTGNTSSYNFTADIKGAYAYINSLSRENDSGIWRCVYKNENAAIEIKVYTIPSGLSITQNTDQNVDLSVTSVVLQCKTTNCTYPVPTIQWIFKDQITSSETWYVTVIPTEKQEPCAAQEMVYTSILNLPLYTNFSDNSDKNGTFYCRMEYTDASKIIISSVSKNIRFAVQVRNIMLDPPWDRITILNGTNTTFRCNAGPSRPRPVIRWWVDGNEVSNLAVTKITGTDSLFNASSELNVLVIKTPQDKIVYCDAKFNGQVNAIESKKTSINVWYQPSIPSVQTVKENSFPWLENQTGTLQCVMADPGNPKASLKWTHSRGIMDMDGNLVFRNLSAMDDGQYVYCQVQNNFTDIKGLTVVSLTIALNVEYRPIVTLNPSEKPLRIKEGSNLTVTCNASGNPLPMVHWKNMNPSSNTLLIHNIQRSSTGSYTCEASSTSKRYNHGVLQREESTTVVVEYAPDVTVNISGSSVVGSTAVLMCTAQGEPSQYTFHPWIHRVGQTEIRRLNGEKSYSNSNLSLSNISIQDMGSYICSVDNSITGLDGQLNQTSDNSLYVQGSPVIGETQSSFTGEIGKPESIEIPFYSNSSQMRIEFRRNSDLFVMTNTSDVSVYITPSNITLTFYTKKLTIPGHVAVLSYTNVTNKMFDNYTLHLSNENGNVTKVFEFISSGPPLAPKNFFFSHIDEGFLVFVIEKGFNGGHEQTFIVEYKSSGNLEANWSTVLRINETNLAQSSKNGVYYIKIPKLQDGQQHIFRVYAENVKGTSSAVEAVYSDIKTGEDHSSVGVGVGGAVGVSVGGVVGVGVGGVVFGCVGAIIVYTIRRRINGSKNSCFRSNGKTDDSAHTYSNTEMNRQPVNQIYEELNKENRDRNRKTDDGTHTNTEMISHPEKPIYEKLNRGNVDQNTYDKISPVVDGIYR